MTAGENLLAQIHLFMSYIANCQITRNLMILTYIGQWNSYLLKLETSWFSPSFSSKITMDPYVSIKPCGPCNKWIVMIEILTVWEIIQVAKGTKKIFKTVQCICKLRTVRNCNCAGFAFRANRHVKFAKLKLLWKRLKSSIVNFKHPNVHILG